MRFFPHPEAGVTTKLNHSCHMTEKEWRSIPVVKPNDPLDMNLVRNHYLHQPKISWLDEAGNCIMQKVLFITPPTIYVTPM